RCSRRFLFRSARLSIRRGAGRTQSYRLVQRMPLTSLARLEKSSDLSNLLGSIPVTPIHPDIPDCRAPDESSGPEPTRLFKSFCLLPPPPASEEFSRDQRRHRKFQKTVRRLPF